MVPKYTEFYLPTLEVLSDIESKDINILIDAVASLIGLTDDDKLITTRSGNQLQYRSNISWAVTDLNQGGFIERSGRGMYVITMKGLEFLDEKPTNPNRKTLAEKSEQFRDFLNRQGTRTKKKTASNLSNEVNSVEILPLTKDGSYNNISKNHSNPNNINLAIERGSDSVSLNELYQTLNIMRKANLSTDEIVAKINQLEKKSIIDRHASSLVKEITMIASEIDYSGPIIVEFLQNQNMILEIGDYHFSFDLQKNVSTIQEVTKNTTALTKSSSNSKYCKDKTTSKIKPSLQNIDIDPGKSYSGIWFKQLTSQTFAIYGDIKPHIYLLKSYGGMQNNHPEYGNGWIFLNGKRKGLEKDLKEFIIPEPNLKKNDKLLAKEKMSASAQKSDEEHPDLSDNEKDMVSKYCQQLSILRPFNFLGVTGPHKAVLLIAIFFLIKTKRIVSPKIYYSDEIENKYDYYWNRLIGGSPTLGASYPFAHLGRDTIFHHNMARSLRDYDKTWNKQILSRYIHSTNIAPKLFELLKNSKANDLLSACLIDKYCKSSIAAVNQHIENESSVQSGNQKDNFLQYMENAGLSKNGHSYSASSIKVYVGSFKNQIVREIVEEFDDQGDIFNIVDLESLQVIAKNIDKAIGKKIIPNASKFAINHYINYIDSLSFRNT